MGQKVTALLQSDKIQLNTGGAAGGRRSVAAAAACRLGWVSNMRPNPT